jgi:hypothetical protein
MKQALQLAAGVVIGAVVPMALLVVPWPSLRIGWPGWVAVAVALPVIFLVLVAVHEGGHLVAGAAARFRPCLFIVGPVKFERRDSGWSAGVNRVFPLAGGMVGATPEGIDGLRPRMLALVAGGPAASLAFGFAAVSAMAVFTGADTTLTGAAAVGFVVVAALGLGSLMLGMIALIPGDKHGFSSDGARILRFLRSGPQVDAEVALLGLGGASMGGQRPRDWDAALVASTLRLPPGAPMGVAARIFAHLHWLDRDDPGQARVYLREALKHRGALPAMSQPSLLLHAAYFESIHDASPESARERLAQAGEGALVSPHARTMAEAAVLLAEGDDRAAAHLALAASQLPLALDRGSARMAADLIGRMQRLLEGPR